MIDINKIKIISNNNYMKYKEFKKDMIRNGFDIYNIHNELDMYKNPITRFNIYDSEEKEVEEIIVNWLYDIINIE